MHLARIQAIFEKDLKDFMKNTMMLFTPFIPIILAIMYNRIGAGTDEEIPIMIHYTLIGVTFAAVTAGGLMMLMAEEKEKGTLRGLMLSPASFLDIIIGKSAVITLLSFASLIISLMILGIEPFLDFQIIIGILILYTFFLLLGIGIGLFVKNVGITTAYTMPIMFIFGFTPMLEMMGFSSDSMTMKIADIFPVTQLLDMHDTHRWTAILIVLLWTLAALLFTFICYKNARKDK